MEFLVKIRDSFKLSILLKFVKILLERECFRKEVLVLYFNNDFWGKMRFYL